MKQDGVFTRLVFLWCSAFLLVLSSSCTKEQLQPESSGAEIRFARMEEKQAGQPITEEEIGAVVASFAGELVDLGGQATDELKKGATTTKERGAVMMLQLDYLNAIVDIAIGPEPELNLVDMIVLVTLSRITLEDYWVPEVFGDSGEKLLETIRRIETDIWAAAPMVLEEEQQEELRDLIQEWRQNNPDQYRISNIRFTDLAKGQKRAAKKGQKHRGVLAEVKVASTAIDEFTLVAQQLLVIVKVLPTLAVMEAELSFYEIISLPEMETLLKDADRLTQVSERLADQVEKMPEWVSAERQQLLQDLASEEKRLRGLLTDVRQTMAEGGELISLANTTVNSVDSLTDRLESGPFAENLATFDIREYRHTAAEASKTLRELNLLLESVGPLMDTLEAKQSLPFVIQVVDSLDKQMEGWITRAFVLAAALILIFFLSLLGYRYLSKKL